MTTRLDVLGLVALGALLGACNSPAQSSSSSHWLECHDLGDCRENANAVACSAGYCVDSRGRRLVAEEPSSGGSGGSGPITDGGGAASTGGATSTGGAMSNGGQGAVSGGGSGPGPCDPLAARELPVTLGTILGVGKDADGVTYLADEVKSSNSTTPDRVFVSEGTSLFRQHVTGTGQSGPSDDGDYSLTYEARTDNATFTLYVQRRSGKAAGMGVAAGRDKGFLGTPGVNAAALTLEDVAVIKDFTLRNLPGDVTVQFVADLDDGNVMIVTHPTDDYGYEDFRMFYGPPTAPVERRVLNTIRSGDGETFMDFQVDGTEYHADFAWVFIEGPDGGIISHPDPGTLDEGNGKTVGFTQRWPTPTTLPGFSFTCL